MREIDNFTDAEREYQNAHRKTEEEFKKYKNKQEFKYTMFFIGSILFILGVILLCTLKTKFIYGLVLVLLSLLIGIILIFVKDDSYKYENLKRKEEYLKDNYIAAKAIHDEILRRHEWCRQNFPEDKTWDDLNIVEKEGYLSMYLEKYKEKTTVANFEYDVKYIDIVFCYFFETTYEEVLYFYTKMCDYYRSQEYEKDLKDYENIVSKI